MVFKRFFVLLFCMLSVVMPARAARLNKEWHTWENLQSLGPERAIFFAACDYPDKYRWIMYFPAGQTRGWFALLTPKGEDDYYGNADISKVSEFGASVGFGLQTQRIAQFLGEKLFASKFTLLKPKDFHLVFDGTPSFVCPKNPESVLEGPRPGR